MIIINESPFLVEIIKKYNKNKDNIKIISTSGFLNDYFYLNGKIITEPRPSKKIQNFVNEISKLKNEEIIIATDKDNMGKLIALEVLSYLNDEENDIYYLTINFDELINKDFYKEDIYNYLTKEIEINETKLFLNTIIQEAVLERRLGFNINNLLLTKLFKEKIKNIHNFEGEYFLSFLNEMDLYKFISNYIKTQK